MVTALEIHEQAQRPSLTHRKGLSTWQGLCFCFYAQGTKLSQFVYQHDALPGQNIFQYLAEICGYLRVDIPPPGRNCSLFLHRY